MKATKLPTERKAIRVVAEEIGVPFNTVKAWIQGGKVGATAPKKPKKPEHNGTSIASDLPALIAALEHQNKALERIAKELSLLRQEKKRPSAKAKPEIDDLPF